jgi:hypothetical protein
MIIYFIEGFKKRFLSSCFKDEERRPLKISFKTRDLDLRGED